MHAPNAFRGWHDGKLPSLFKIKIFVDTKTVWLRSFIEDNNVALFQSGFVLIAKLLHGPRAVLFNAPMQL